MKQNEWRYKGSVTVKYYSFSLVSLIVLTYSPRYYVWIPIQLPNY